MYTENYAYSHDEQNLQGYLVFDDAVKGKRPAVLVVHDWSGRNAFACNKARQLAELGYVGFALDVYGDGQLGETNEQKMELMAPFIEDRSFLRERLQAGLHALVQRPEVDAERIAVIGFCFGGLCALDLARSGADIRGAVSFHGLLEQPKGVSIESIKAKILVLHGYDDPMVTPEQVEQFCHEMTVAQVDWQVHMYGHTKHAFTNPLAQDDALGTVYNQVAEQRSWVALKNFLTEIFE